MLARVTTLEAPPDKVDDAARYVREQVIPQLKQMDGFKGFRHLVTPMDGYAAGWM